MYALENIYYYEKIDLFKLIIHIAMSVKRVMIPQGGAFVRDIPSVTVIVTISTIFSQVYNWLKIMTSFHARSE